MTQKRYQREIQTQGLRIRETNDGEKESRTITGTAIVFNTPTTLYKGEDKEIREQILPEAVTRELLDRSDIKMTMFHNRELILARSVNGKGTLRYTRTGRGVDFEFDAPATVDGDKALALVRSGDLSGCSFAFSIYDWNTHADRETFDEGGTKVTLYSVREIAGIHDFTIAADPAYPTTEVAARCRELAEAESLEAPKEDRGAGQVREMRRMAAKRIRI